MLAFCCFTLQQVMIDPELLLQGYRLGVFPMAMENGSIEWFSPDPRAILPLEDFHVPHALRGLLRKKIFETKIDNRFLDVIEACAALFLVNRCFIALPTHRRSRWWRWSSICVPGNLHCSIRSGSRRICNNSAASKFRGTIICDSCAEQSNYRVNSRPQNCRRRPPWRTEAWRRRLGGAAGATRAC